MGELDIQAAKARWTKDEQNEWLRGYPYSAKFTQGVVHQLVAALEALEEAHRKLEHWEHGVANDQDCPYKVERDEVQGKLGDVRKVLDKDTERLSLWFSVDRILSKEGE